VWEIYNEPNRPTFWTDPSAEEYMKLLKVVVPAMRQAKSNLVIMAPGLGHNPALNIYHDLRCLMDLYGKRLPIVSSEWGYSSEASFANTPQGHADYLTRTYLINLSNDVLSIGNKLEAGSPDPSADSYERGFSWFNEDGSAKPFYSQVKAMTQALTGLSFVKRLPSDGNDYVMEFSDGTITVPAVWTTVSTHTVNVFGQSVSIDGKPVYVYKQNGSHPLFA
jgi:hypothetical protein